MDVNCAYELVSRAFNLMTVELLQVLKSKANKVRGHDIKNCKVRDQLLRLAHAGRKVMPRRYTPR